MNREYVDLIELLYSKDLLDERNYLAAMKFRWLYAKVFGNSHVKAYDFTRIIGRDIELNEEWFEKVALQYKYIRDILVKERYYQNLFDLCILNLRPRGGKSEDYILSINRGLELFEKSLIEILTCKNRQIKSYNYGP